MVTLHTLIAILLLHLQALYNVIILTFIIAINLFPVGVAGVNITLLRLLREVDKGIESVNYREGVGRGGGSINILK